MTRPAAFDPDADRLREECGVFGIFVHPDAAAITVLGVIAGSTIWWFTLTTIVGIFHRHIDIGVMRNINRIFGAVVTLFGVVVLGDLASRLA